MKNKNTQWFVAGIAGALIIMFLFSFTQTIKTSQNGKMLDAFLNVSMPRPLKDLVLGFSLEGRNVIYDIEALVGTETPVVAAIKKAAGTDTKAVVDKGPKKAKMSPAAAAVKKRAQINEQRRKAFQARVIEQAERYRQSLRAQALANNLNKNPQAEEFYQNQKTQNPVATSDNEVEKKEVITSAEWKSLILSQPTEANIQKMIKALPANEIDIETYLEISESLIKDNSQEKKNMGLKALGAVYRQEAFILAAHLATETDTNTQKLLTDYMYNYNRVQTLSVFDQVLKSSDLVAATAAVQAVSKAIQSLQSGANQAANTSGRNPSRSGTIQQLSLSSYKQLIPILKIVISKNLNTVLSSLAQNLLSQLQTLSTTA